MAKLSRNGAEYFPLDVYLDDKFKFIEIKYRLEGFAIVIKLYQRIYGFGYWCNWNDEVALLFADELRAGPDLISGVVEECLKRGIFDSGLYEQYGILTSLGIQKRYGEIIKRRKETELIGEYILPGSGLVFTDSRHRPARCKQEAAPEVQPDDIQEENADSVDTGNIQDADTVHASCSHNADTVHADCSPDDDTMPTQCLHDVDILHASCEHDVSRSEQTKGNETKLNEIKSKTHSSKRDRFDPALIVDLYHQLCPSLPAIVKLTDGRKTAIKSALARYGEYDIQTAFAKAQASDFLTGRAGGDRSWSCGIDWLLKPANTVKVLEGIYDNKKQAPPNTKFVQSISALHDWVNEG